jgi:hypothetical protein|nr:MAG TPA: dimeris T4 recombination endonuclease VII [Caudoviricetes sp.]
MTDNNVKKTRFAGLVQDENGQVRLQSDEVPESELIGLEAGASGGEFNGGGELQAKFEKLLAENSGLTSQLDAVNLLAAGLESGVLNPVEGDGAAARLHAALSGIQESMATLAESRDSAVEKSELLQKQVDDLLAQAEQARLADAEANEVAELKAKLDAAKVTYRSNASKESLQKQVDELPKA